MRNNFSLGSQITGPQRSLNLAAKNQDMNRSKIIASINSRTILPQNLKQESNMFMSLKSPMDAQNSIGTSFKPAKIAPATQPSLVRPPPGPPGNKTDLLWGGNGNQNNGFGNYWGGGGNNNNGNNDSEGEESDPEDDDLNMRSSIVNLLGINAVWKRDHLRKNE